MSLVSLDLFKKWCHRDDLTDSDDIIQAALDAAEGSVIRATHRTVEELLMMGNGTLPAPLRMAVMMSAADALANPEGTAPGNFTTIAMGVKTLINQYRKLSDRCE